jgi:UDP-N-acetylglucosamine transferase subunit ALG13
VIFVTVGSMFPFDRLIRAMDEWARRHASERVFAQIGEGAFLPRHMSHARMLPPARFREVFAEASLVVAHAGMGSVISAASIGKSIVLIPRHSALKEHTTDHQLHTAAWLRDRPGIFVADSESDVELQIEKARMSVGVRERLEPAAPPEFIAKIRHAVASLS